MHHMDSSARLETGYLVSYLQVGQVLGGQVCIENNEPAQADVVHIVVRMLQRQKLEKAWQQSQPEVKQKHEVGQEVRT